MAITVVHIFILSLLNRCIKSIIGKIYFISSSPDLGHPQKKEAVVRGEFRDSHSKREKIHWACDNCLENGKALLADPTKQIFVDCVPYYAYFNLPFVYETCGKDFVLSSNEQRYWYENLKFWVQSQPKNCAD